TEGPNEGELHCLTGDCNGMLECSSWGLYGVSLAEIAIFPDQNPPSMFPDLSYVESGTNLPLKFTVDGCLELSCDTSHVKCPDSMQIMDQNGKLLECACGAKDWNDLLDPILGCPNQGGAGIQKAWKAACPDIYSFASDDSSGQKYCPFSNAGMQLDIGEITSSNPLQVPMEMPKDPTVTTTSATSLVWGPGVPGFSEWSKTFVWDGH
ncbi:MAG: hypothetical protein EOP45_13865, partial [Sphingobacteriaceae bacterium]